VRTHAAWRQRLDLKRRKLDRRYNQQVHHSVLSRKVIVRNTSISSSRCEGGLGSVASDVTGFGVGWGLRMLQESPR